MQLTYKGIDFAKIAIALLAIKVIMASQVVISFPIILENLCIIFAVGMFGIKMLRSITDWKSMCTYTVLSLGIVLTCFVMRQYDLLISFIAIFLLKDEAIDETVKLILIIQAAAIALIFFASGIYAGRTPGEDFVVITGTRVRYGGGFLHPNLLSCHILSCSLMYVWLNYHRMNWKKYMGLCFVTVLGYAITKSRTSLIIGLCMMILHFFMQKEWIQKICRTCLKYAFPFMSTVMFYGMTHYLHGHSWIVMLDELITGRLELAAYAYERSGLTFLPRYLEYRESGVIPLDDFWGLTTFAFDNIYTFLFVEMGVLWLIALAVMLWVFIEKTDDKCHFFVIVWIVYGITEVQGFNVFRFFPLLLLTLLFKTRETVNESATS